MNRRSGENENPRPDPEFWIAVVITLLVCMPAFVGGYQYYLGKERDKSSLIALFIVPFSFQVIGLFILYFRTRKGEDIRRFYWFCLVYMPVCLLSYFWMWMWYALNWSSFLGQWTSLVLIFILIVPASGMTYTILESRDNNQPGIDHTQAERSLHNDLSSIDPMQPGRESRRLTDLLHHGILLRNMKDSASNAPYLALLFFLGMFLAVTYLFSFAFAFHDRAQLDNIGGGQPTNVRPPALYMSPAAYGDNANNQDIPEINAGDDRKSQPKISFATPPRYRFYFDTDTAKPKYGNTRIIAASDGKSREAIDENRKWREKKNSENLEDLVREIREKTINGNRIRLELEGVASSSFPDRKIFVSGYELAEVRAQAIKNEILKKLSDRRAHHIEWHCVPLPDETPDEALRNKRIDIKEINKEIDKNVDVLNAVLSGRPEHLFKYRKILEQPTDNLRRLLKIGEHEDDLVEMLSHHKYVIGMIEKGVTDPEEIKEEEINKVIKDFIQELDHIEHTGVTTKAGADPRRNVVEVFLSVLHEQPLFYKFELMDYVIYVITGADYGDVIPLTSFAKFLSSFAHILQIFFVVALFSAVLSLKKPSSPICKVAPDYFHISASPSREGYNVSVEAPKNFQWKAETNADWIAIGEKGRGKFYFSVERNDRGLRIDKIIVGGADVIVEQDPSELPSGGKMPVGTTTVTAEVVTVTVEKERGESSIERDVVADTEVIPINRE